MKQSVRRVVLRENFASAWRQLMVHPLRSFLTILGIAIGMSSLISMMGIGEGTRQKIVSEMERLGETQIIYIQHKRPVFMEMAGPWSREDHLTRSDLEALPKASRHIEKLAPVIFMEGETEARGKTFDGRQIGTTPDFAAIRKWTARQGRFLRKGDLDERSRVCVLGSRVAEVLFGSDDPVGRQVLVNGREYTVVGRMAKLEFETGRRLNETVVLPVATMARLLPVQDKFSQIVVQVEGQEYVAVVKSQLRKVLNRRHDRTDKFMINSQADIIRSVNESSLLMRFSFGTIAMIVLLVGGIGIMNLMLISVTERTREIGVHMAVGATRKDILGLFLLESVVLSFIGGVLGVIVGTLGGHYLSFVISNYLKTELSSVISIKVILIALLSSIGIGLAFGFYPAWNASRTDPAEALTYE